MMDYSRLMNKTEIQTPPSGIRKYFDMLSGRKDVISLTVGQPDFPTPWHVRQAGIRSLEEGRTYYTANAGLSALREEICAYMQRRFDLHYEPLHECVVTVGGSEAIDLAVRALIEPGDEVILPLPAFVCYEPLVRLVGGVPVIIETKKEDRFKLTAAALRAAITPRTKLLILPFPNNPPGAILDRDDLEQIAAVLRGTDIFVLSDEIYAELTYGRRHVSIASLPDMWERTIIVNGFSKTYAMTGWRLGFVLAPEPLITQMNKLHQYQIMCAPTTSQYAALEALRNGDEDIEYMKSQYNRRRVLLLEGLEQLGMECFAPEGAFYVFPRLPQLGWDSEEFCRRLLEEEGVALVPGVAFGACGEGFARISYAYSVKHLNKALERMDSFLRKHGDR